MNKILLKTENDPPFRVVGGPTKNRNKVLGGQQRKVIRVIGPKAKDISVLTEVSVNQKTVWKQ